MDATGHGHEVESLDAEECWRLLRLSKIGRLAITTAEGRPDVLPLNYLVNEQCIYFRSAPGGKLDGIGAHPDIAFEIDGQDEERRWSVVVHGTAHVMTTGAEIEASGIALLLSWSPTRKDNFVRVEPQTVSGRRFPKRYAAQPIAPAPHAPAAAESEAQDWSGQDGVLPKPWPIPHLPPPERKK